MKILTFKNLLVNLGRCCAAMVLAGSVNASEPVPLADSLSGVAEFSLFYNALKQADMLKIINDLETVSIFIPSNSALEAEGSAFLLKSVLLTEDNHARLVSVLAQHIVQADVSAMIQSGKTFEVAAISGACVTISRSDTSAGQGMTTTVDDHATVLSEKLFGHARVFVTNHLLYQSWQDQSICHPTS